MTTLPQSLRRVLVLKEGATIGGNKGKLPTTPKPAVTFVAQQPAGDVTLVMANGTVYRNGKFFGRVPRVSYNPIAEAKAA